MKTTLVDAHVHIHPCFDDEIFLTAAYNNFQKIAARRFKTTEFIAMLLLTESQGTDWFGKAASHKQLGNWSAAETAEPFSLNMTDNNGNRIIAVAGRQIVTAERLEVLALGTTATTADGQNISDVIEWVRDQNALPILPWGVGKWTGIRGKQVAGLLHQASPGDFFLGDNGNRPNFWPRHNLFREAEQKGIADLPGSDPLPFPSEGKKAGTSGFALHDMADSNTPFKSLAEGITKRSDHPDRYIQKEHMLGFVKNQFSIQIKKRFS